MIIHTEHTLAIAEWIDESCPSPSRYKIDDDHGADIVINRLYQRRRIILNLTHDDMTLFHKRFAGLLIRDQVSDVWYDRDSISELVIKIRSQMPQSWWNV